MATSRRLATSLVSAGLVVLCSCGGGGRDVAAPPSPGDACVLFKNFEAFSNAARNGGVASPEQYESYLRGLIDGASKLAQVRPELRSTLDVVVNSDLAAAAGKPLPPPDPGQVTLATADATLSGYRSQACPGQ